MNDATGTAPGTAPTAADADTVGAAIGAETDKYLAPGNADALLSAQSLLAGRPWVGIEHNGQHYRLQTTRAGKLILTK